MKKIFMSVMLCGSLALTMTGCGNNGNDSGESSVSSPSSPEESSSEESSSDDSSDSSSDDSSEESSDESDAGGDKTDESGVDNSMLAFPENRAGRMAKAALEEDNWPGMDIVSEPEMVGAMFSTADGEVFNLDDLEEHCFCTNVISAQLYKVIVVKPVNGREGAVEDAIGKYLDYSQNGAAFYPEQEESAAGAVSGKTADNYIYLIVHKNGRAIADAIKDVQ